MSDNTEPKGEIAMEDKIEKIANGVITSKLFETKQNAELWQVEVVKQITEATKSQIQELIDTAVEKARIDEVKRISIGSTPEVREFYINSRIKQLKKGRIV